MFPCFPARSIMACIRLKRIEKFPRGQSLMETIVAIAILLTVATAILSLVTNNIIGQKESEFQIMANNLAREGIEVARNIRDSNSLGGRDWDAGLNTGEAIAAFDTAANGWQLIFASEGGESYNKQLYFSSLYKIYSHNKTGGQLAPFSRFLNLGNICLASGAESIKDSCGAGEKKIGFKVSAVVSWKENNRTRQVVLEELLYAWK